MNTQPAPNVLDRSAEPFPRSIAIAGAWGYIGRKFLDAARVLGRTVIVYDPGPVPDDLDLQGATRIDTEADFYRQPADLFHLALHPEHRQFGIATLLRRSHTEPIRILCEKPMAAPDRPQDCAEVVAAVDQSGAILLYDFPELFDPITRRIEEFLTGFRSVAIESIELRRSKDREDPANPRNYKRMVTIQFQESVHCLAFMLHFLATVRGSVAAVLADGLTAEAEAQPYNPPNPEAYPAPVDGRCQYRLQIGGTAVEGVTDFKRGAPWAKQRVIRGRGDGQPFVIEADYLEGRKQLSINGQSQDAAVPRRGRNHVVRSLRDRMGVSERRPHVVRSLRDRVRVSERLAYVESTRNCSKLADNDLETNSYAAVIETFGRWSQHIPRETLLHGLYPNPRFAHVTYQLSQMLWQASREGRTVRCGAME